MVFFVLMLLSIPLSQLWDYGLTDQNIVYLTHYFATYFPEFTTWTGKYFQWLISGKSYIPYFPFIGFISVLAIGLIRNPYSFAKNTYGSARFAHQHDVKKMGLLDGFLMVLGSWNNKFLQLPETLSVLSLAPPGTGKTAAIVIPTILTADKVSLIINDVKPELADITSGYRATKSRVYRLEWGAEDNADQGIFYPSWNPLSPGCMPQSLSKRDLYIDRLTNVLVESSGGDGNMDYFKNKARACLSGLMHFLVDRCQQNKYSILPRSYTGKEPSIPMLQDWLTIGQNQAQEKGSKDPLNALLKAAIKESQQFNYNPRIINELTEVVSTADKERASIISVMNEALNIFKNRAVRARTSHSDFAFADLRGVKNPQTGEWQPVTVYICVNQEDNRTLSKITALFCEALSAYLIANPPNKVTDDGKELGPFPAAFILDEFPQMPKLQALIDGPAVGRGQKVSYLMIGQDIGQIEEKYGNEGVETLLSTTAAKVILPLNNEKTAQRFSDMVGKKTIITKSKSMQMTNTFNPNITKSESGIELIKPEDFLSMPAGKHVVLFQKYLNRPILCDTPMYFKDKRLKSLVATTFGGKMDIAPPMPFNPTKIT